MHSHNFEHHSTFGHCFWSFYAVNWILRQLNPSKRCLKYNFWDEEGTGRKPVHVSKAEAGDKVKTSSSIFLNELMSLSERIKHCLPDNSIRPPIRFIPSPSSFPNGLQFWYSLLQLTVPGLLRHHNESASQLHFTNPQTFLLIPPLCHEGLVCRPTRGMVSLSDLYAFSSFILSRQTTRASQRGIKAQPQSTALLRRHVCPSQKDKASWFHLGCPKNSSIVFTRENYN